MKLVVWIANLIDGRPGDKGEGEFWVCAAIFVVGWAVELVADPRFDLLGIAWRFR